MEEIPTLKILTLGDASVGKTCILLRFSEDEFPTVTMPTIGIEYKTKLVQIQGEQVKLQVWDTAGQERYHRTLASTFYRRANGIVLVFDLTDRNSLDHVENWMKQIRQKADPKVAIILVGNKMDLIDQTTFPDGKALADSYGIPFFMVSAKTGKNIAEVYNTLSDMIVRQDPTVLQGNNAPPATVHVRTPPVVQKKDTMCCK
ncbi:unnamed protein product [Blepharisma stoltei]|uniref:Uncharacterized protein n=1 Tax=Blepharisma stoltei TaxID=1481888 RepID=A0AAU9J7Y9_9CILI|nr:unnamed protein product [Blepharisma stoltei]